MAVARAKDTQIDISQNVILDKFTAYLKQQKRAQIAIDATQEGGWCVGFTLLAVYAKWLELTQPFFRDSNGDVIPRDDWPWMESLLKRLSIWDETKVDLSEQSKNKKKFAKQVDRLISLSNFFQNANKFSSILLLDFLAKLQDTNNRQFLREYSISGIFNAAEFNNKITIRGRETSLLKEVVQENRMVFMWITDHLVGLIKHENIYYYYDSNNPKGWLKYKEDETEKFILNFFKEYDYAPAKAYGFGFCAIACSDQKPKNYTPQAEILAALSVPGRVSGEEVEKITALSLAAENCCDACMQYNLAHPPIPLNQYLKVEDNEKCLALHTAVLARYSLGVTTLLNSQLQHLYSDVEKWIALKYAMESNFEDIMLLILPYDIKLNLQVDADKKTLLIIATLKANLKMMRLLLSRGADPNLKTKLGFAAMHYAADSGSFPAIELLAKHADVNLPNQEGDTSLKIALTKNHRAMVDFLIRLPTIQVSMAEYAIISTKLQQEPNNKKIQQWLHIAQTNLLIQKIKLQTELVNQSYPAYYEHEVKSALCAALKFIKQKDLKAREKSMWLLFYILPVFKRSITIKKTMQIWQPIQDFATPIFQLMQMFDISTVDIKNCCSPTRNVYRV